MVTQALEAEVNGKTIESGHERQKEDMAHALKMLELIGKRDVPVGPGSTYPPPYFRGGDEAPGDALRQAGLQGAVEGQAYPLRVCPVSTRIEALSGCRIPVGKAVGHLGTRQSECPVRFDEVLQRLGVLIRMLWELFGKPYSVPISILKH